MIVRPKDDICMLAGLKKQILTQWYQRKERSIKCHEKLKISQNVKKNYLRK